MILQDDVSEFYNSYAWRKLSKQVIKEHHNECYLCKQNHIIRSAVLVHHFNELKKRPDLAYSRTYIDENGKIRIQLMPLCFDCHESIHHRGTHYESKDKFTTPERW